MIAKAYHHGDLRNALLQAGLDLLETEGLQGLTLRGVAARAGVSHAAPAHHFGNLPHLLDALTTIAFERFEAAMAQERAVSAADAASQVNAAGRGYVAFARRHPALFRLMFTRPFAADTDPALAQASLAAKRHLQETSALVAAKLGISTLEGREKIEKLVWSSIHGFTHLELGGFMHAAADQGPGIDLAKFLLGGGTDSIV